MRKNYLLADIALNDSLNTDILFKEPKRMKVKTTFYSRSKGVDYDPVIHVSYPKSRADQLSYSPTSKLVDQMFRTGQLVMAAKNQFDFADGKDDGRDVPFDRLRGLDLPEVSQALAESEKKLADHEKNLKAMAKNKKAEKDETADNPPPTEEGSKAD